MTSTTSSLSPEVKQLLSNMTLEEKIGQMNLYNGFWEVTGPVPASSLSRKKYSDIQKGNVGGMLNVWGVEEVRKIQQIAVEESRLGIPLLFGHDVVHGFKTLSPIPLAEAASWDLAVIEKAAQVAAREATASGINWTFAPMVDISRDARWGRVMEGAGEDPYLGSLIAQARVKGFQGNDLSAPHTLAATAKHFAAYGFVEGGKEYNTADLSPYNLYNVALPPFKAAAEAGVKSMMVGFNLLNGQPLTANRFLQRTLLKETWGFEGFIVSDWATIQEMETHGFSASLKDASISAANAGTDMDMEAFAFVNYLQEAVEAGKVPMSVIDDAAGRILQVKWELGLFDDPYRYCNAERERMEVYHPDHQEAVLDMAKRSMVLLKNQGNVLPLSPAQKNIALIGPLAADKNSPLGSWRIASDDGTAVSVLEGLQAMTNQVTYEPGPALFTGTPSFTQPIVINESDRAGMEAAVELARNSEVVIMVLGEHGFQSGEGRSRTQLGLPGLQLELLKAVYKVNSNIVLVLLNGRPLTLTWEVAHIPAILEAWQPGSQGGHAIAQVLFGEYNPSGKLPMTFPRSIGQVPIYYNHFNTGRPEPKDYVFWTHYSDEDNAPLFPFGYGLSYTKFGYSNLTIDTSNNEAIVVKVTVTNTGDRVGEEVAQLYIRDLVATYVRPVRELKGFKKILLEPGEAQVVNFELTEKELGYYSPGGAFMVEPGTFEVMVGPNSQIGLLDRFELK